MHKFILTIVFVFFFALSLYSQTLGPRYEVEKLSFQGNEEINHDKLLNVIRTRETPWAVWKWIYNRFDKEILGGQKPEYFDRVVFDVDYHQLKRFYEDNGFFHCVIDTIIRIQPEEERVYLTFAITEGRQSIVDTILYKGFENLPPDVIKELSSNKQINVGEPYIQNKAEGEFKRSLAILSNNGYVNAKVISVGAKHYASTDNFSIVYVFDTGKRYTFGKISIEQDTISQQLIDSTIVLRHLDFTTGEYYSVQKRIESEKNLNRLGIFEATKIEDALPDVLSDNIPVKVFIRARSFQELTPEIGVNDENNAFNMLFGVGYNHRNFFGGARNFSTRLRLNLQTIRFGTIFDGSPLRDSSFVSKVELTTQLIQPYFINNKTSISVALSAMLDKQPSYYIPSLTGRIGTQSQTTTSTKLFIDWNLQLSNPKTVATQHDTIIGNDFQTQFNSFITITLQRDKRNDIFYPSAGNFQSISIEEGGFFPRVFGKTLGVDLPYSQYVKMTLNGQWYWDPTNSKDIIWATRWHAGAALLYGYSPLKDIPFTQRFYAGGSGSVRGWRARDLGMVPSKTEGGDALIEGNIEARWNLLKGAGALGFIDLEKISLVFFYDCGNVWTVPEKTRLSEIAMAFGFGIRYNTIAGPIRIDFGMKLYDPDAPETRRWVTQKRFFPETFNEGVIHLGVGNTF